MKVSMRKSLITLLLIAAIPAVAQSRQGSNRRGAPYAEECAVYSGPPGKRGGSLVVSCVGEPKTLNPILANESSSYRVIEFLNATMFGYDAADQGIADGLVKSYSATPDGLTWTFNLRKGIRWSDGQPFDADDVLFTFRVIFDANLGATAQSGFVQADQSYPKVDRINAHSVRFTLSEPSALFLVNLSAGWLLPRHKLAKAYERGEIARQFRIDAAAGDVVGLGPFRLKKRVDTESGMDRLILERNPYYWKKDRVGLRLPYLDEVVVRIAADQNAAFVQFQVGTTDALVVRPDELGLLERAKSDGKFTIHDLGPGLNVTYLLFNRNDPTPSESGKIEALDIAKRGWFSKEKFRQAISFAVDRERIVNRVFGGRAAPVYSFTTPGNRYWYDPAVVRRYPRDLGESKRLLAEIGIEDRNGDGLLEDSKGNRIEFTIRTNHNNPSRLAIVLQIVEDLEELGIVATAQPVPFADLVNALHSTHDFDAVVGGWQSGIPPDPVIMKNIILSSGVLHYSRPNQSEPATPWEARIDELMHQNGRTLDLAARQRQFAEVTRLWSEKLPEIDLIASHYILAIRNRIGNFRPAFSGEGAWNIDELFIRDPARKENPASGKNY